MRMCVSPKDDGVLYLLITIGVPPAELAQLRHPVKRLPSGRRASYYVRSLLRRT